MNQRSLMHVMVLLISATWYCTSQAAVMTADVKGSDLRWQSADAVGGDIAPSIWELPSNLPVAEKVILGGVENIAEQTVVLRSSSGAKTVSVPLTVKGMVYRLSSNRSEATETGNTANTVVTEVMAQVTGKGLGSKSVTLVNTSSPITHYRPILAAVNSTAWVTAFKTAAVAPGRYYGTLSIRAMYDYVRDGIRIRYALPFSLTVMVEYSSLRLTTVEISPSNEMKATYHYPSEVSAETTYTIEATGYFPGGVLMGLVAPTGKDYFSLRSSKPENANEIRYNVTCMSGCSKGQQLVVNGEPKVDTSLNVALIDAITPERATAKLKVDFGRIKQTDFAGDTYRGTFTLMFKPSL
ncbi:hypothetical protein [Vibrio jasicida]|uniref:hypothetical protein n=1 Tax=Vibrio jasicida TaxID=766224 RepID=UPI000698CB82|nr:hypothetical protein [Vibrio jasicida]